LGFSNSNPNQDDRFHPTTLFLFFSFFFKIFGSVLGHLFFLLGQQEIG